MDERLYGYTSSVTHHLQYKVQSAELRRASLRNVKIQFCPGMTALKLTVVTVALFFVMTHAKPFEFEDEETDTMEMRMKYLEKRIADIEKCTPCKRHEAFLFPKKEITDYISGGTLDNELDALTACFWVNTTEQEEASLISYANNQHTNAFLVYTNENTLKIIWGSTVSGNGVDITDGKWHHVCVTWVANSETYKIYKDGAVAESGAASGDTIASGGILIFGQDQDSLGGGFRAAEAFTGEMTGVNIWDHVISDAEISELAKSCTAGEGNIVSMADLGEDRVKGGVLKIPSTCNAPTQI